MKHKNPISKQGIYLLPSIFTTAGLFAGFFAIIAAFNGKFETAVIAIFIAMIMDALDGRIARLTKTQTNFGAEYDSLADVISFGLAPALIAFVWSLQYLGNIGWTGAFLYAATAALRLARFNTQLSKADKKYFQGLPSPAAAGVIVGLVGAMTKLDISGEDVAWISLFATILVSVLMVSRIRYSSFKVINLKGKVPFIFIAVLALIIAVILTEPEILLFSIFSIYAISGPILNLYQIRETRKKPKQL